MKHPFRCLILVILGLVGLALTLIILGWIGFVLIGCTVTNYTAKATLIPPAVRDMQKITLENAKQVSHLARLREGSFAAQSAWSPDGKWLALPSAYGVYLFDPQTLTQVRFIEEFARVEKIAFSPDSKWLATSTRRAAPWHYETPTPLTDSTVRVWRISDGTLAREFKGESWVGPAVFSPDNKYLATRSAQDTARLWQLNDGTMAREFSLKQPNDSDPLTRVVFSPDWNVVAIVSAGGQIKSRTPPVRIRLMRLSDGSALRELNEAAVDFDRAENLTFSPDGTLLISTQATFIQSIGQNRYGSRVCVWQVSDGRLVRKWDETDQIFSVTVSPDGSWIAFPNIDHTRFRRLNDGSKMRDVNWARNIVPSPDGKLIASRNEDRVTGGIFALTIWRLGDDNPVRELKEPFTVDGIAFSSDGSVLAAGRLWRVSNGAISNPVKLVGLTDHVDSVAVSRDNQWIATGGMKNLRVWQANDGKLVRELKGITGRVTQIAFSPDGTWLASASADQGVQVWQVSDGSLVRTFSKQAGKLVFSPDGNLLASATGDVIQLWQVNDGSLVRETKGGRRIVSFSPDSKLLASTDAGGTLGLWQVSDGSLVRTLKTADFVSDAAFSADGNLLAVMYMRGTLQLWQVSDGSLIREVSQVVPAIGESIAFSQDGTTLVSAGSRESSIALWGIPPTPTAPPTATAVQIQPTVAPTRPSATAITPTTAAPKPGIANPASTFCVQAGDKSEIRKNAQGGEVGYCVFEDKSECEEWAFMRGECKSGIKSGANTNATVRLTNTDTGKKVDLASGDILEIAFATTTMEGYTWQVMEVNGAVLKQMGEPVFIRLSSNMGNPGVQTWKFQAIGAGSTVLKLGYAQWFNKTAPNPTFQVMVNVK